MLSRWAVTGLEVGARIGPSRSHDREGPVRFNRIDAVREWTRSDRCRVSVSALRWQQEAGVDREQREITELLAALGAGDDAALDELFETVYSELRRLARGQRRRWRGEETLNTTALIHEAYIKLFESGQRGWQGRGHFFAVACKAMRQILIDRARRSSAEKRGGDLQRESLDAVEPMAMSTAAREELLSLDEALSRLERLDPRQARVVECRFFGGLGLEETAEAVGASVPTVVRDWRAARSWLHRELRTGR